nr:MAG TPA: hypothetical protein [Caudoviricetes sp.]
MQANFLLPLTYGYQQGHQRLFQFQNLTVGQPTHLKQTV